MADFAAGYEEWGLQAIVRGSANVYTNNRSTHVMDTNDHHHHHDFLFAFSDLLDHHQTPNKVLDDGLEALYKPFYPASDSTCTPKEVKDEADEEVGEKQQSEEQVLQDMKILFDSSAITTATAYVPKYKRRKNQHKRVVMQVAAEGLSSDRWAWRKYGQKPIKGSPYPRSYYRCSSMKGCLARKQVEQSCPDPTMFILTYTGEHCHSQPTRRNSLAGTVRNKFIIPTPKSPRNHSSSSPSSSEAILSPKPSLRASADQEEELSETRIKQENPDEDHQEQTITDQWGCCSNGELFSNISQFIMMDDEDFFAGLENLDGSSDFRSVGHRP